MGQILYYNGTILTMEDQKPCVEAVLTENGRITDAGTYKDLLERAGSQVRKGDLQGNVMVPGFIDPHSHFTACASNTMEVTWTERKILIPLFHAYRILSGRGRYRRASGYRRPGMTITA